jgi:nucleoside-diphosphate-sugar epimerase
MTALTGWQPRISLDEGLRGTIEWIRENLGQFRVGTYTL